MSSVVNEKVNHLDISWNDPALLNPLPNKEQILDYFSGRSNPFYDRTCNNETIKMQRLSLAHLENMVGVEYILLHEQEPILYVIRKQRRHSPNQVTIIADYYVIAGTVYQAPDLASVCNSRLMTTFHHLDSAFSQALSFSRYHPAKGYTWQFNNQDEQKSSKKKKPETGSVFQISRVDTLLASLTAKFPHKYVQHQNGEKPLPIETSIKKEPKQEKNNFAKVAKPNANSKSVTTQNKQALKAPPEKRLKFM